MNELLIAKGLIALLIVGGLFGFGYFEGLAKGESHRAELEAAYGAIAAVQASQKAQLERDYGKITARSAEEFRNSLSATRRYYDQRLRDAVSSGELPSIPGTPSSADEIPSNALPLAGQCAETTEQLIKLQNWLTASKEASDNVTSQHAGQ